MKRVEWILLSGYLLNLSSGIALASATRIAIMDFRDTDFALALVRCLTVLFSWVLLKSALSIAIIKLHPTTAKTKFLLALSVLAIDMVLCVAIRCWPNHFAHVFGEPFIMRQHTN